MDLANLSRAKFHPLRETQNGGTLWPRGIGVGGREARRGGGSGDLRGDGLKRLCTLVALFLVGATICRAADPPLVTPPGLAASDCADGAKVQAAYRADLTSVKPGDRPATKANLDGLIAVCGAATSAWPLRILRAAMAADDGAYDLALTLLKPVSIDAPGPQAAIAAWLRLRLFALERDQKAFDAERSALLAAVDRALGDPGGRLLGQRLENFNVGATRVSAYRAIVQQGPFTRQMEFIVTPPGAFAEPEAITVTHDSDSAKISAELSASSGKTILPPTFVDRYNCDSQMLLKMLPVDPDYTAMKAIVVAELKARPSYNEGKTTKFRACHWPQFVTPGLGS